MGEKQYGIDEKRLQNMRNKSKEIHEQGNKSALSSEAEIFFV